MEIDYDYLRTGTAIGFRASRELFSNYLLNTIRCGTGSQCIHNDVLFKAM